MSEKEFRPLAIMLKGNWEIVKNIDGDDFLLTDGGISIVAPHDEDIVPIDHEIEDEENEDEEPTPRTFDHMGTREQILNCLRSNPESTPHEVASMLDLSDNQVRQSLYRMRKNHQVKSDEGRYFVVESIR